MAGFADVKSMHSILLERVISRIVLHFCDWRGSTDFTFVKYPCPMERLGCPKTFFQMVDSTQHACARIGSCTRGYIVQDTRCG
jgi:hypothetical protein